RGSTRCRPTSTRFSGRRPRSRTSFSPTARRALYTIAPAGKDARYTRDGGFAGFLRQLGPATGAGSYTVADASPQLGELRRTKSPAELEQLSRAVAITEEAERDAARTIAPGKWEYEVEAVIMAAFLRNGAQRAGFPSI